MIRSIRSRLSSRRRSTALAIESSIAAVTISQSTDQLVDIGSCNFEVVDQRETGRSGGRFATLSESRKSPLDLYFDEIGGGTSRYFDAPKPLDGVDFA